jgi:zinc transport system substrate-binding protein
METRGEPQLIIEGTNNPHTFVFKPSHAKMIEEADIVFWIGEDLEAFMEKPLNSLAKDTKKIAFMDSEFIEKIKFREKNIFDDHEGHEDDDEGHEDDDDHGHKDDDHDDDHKDAHAHAHGEFDPHIWLDPENAKEMVKIIRDELIKIDPEGQRQYSVNTAGATLELDNLINSVEKELSKDISYIVFHDAYQYFENRFGVIPAGALTLNPDVLPGAKQIADIQDVINDKGIKCIFSEPQYNPKIIETLGNDMNVSTGVIDPLGAFIDAGPSMYSELINGIANSIKECH